MFAFIDFGSMVAARRSQAAMRLIGVHIHSQEHDSQKKQTGNKILESQETSEGKLGLVLCGMFSWNKSKAVVFRT